jgi:hypothetical protein
VSVDYSLLHLFRVSQRRAAMPAWNGDPDEARREGEESDVVRLPVRDSEPSSSRPAAVVQLLGDDR